MHDFLLPTSKRHRLFATRRHPDQAALLARIPMINRRVPFRAYWRHQPLRPGRVGRHFASDAKAAMAAAGFGTVMGVRRLMSPRSPRFTRSALPVRGRPDLGRTAGRTRHERRLRRPAMARASNLWGWLMLAIGAASGALAMYYMDPHQGRRRRALVRDKVAHTKNLVTRELPERVERRGRFFRGVARGVAHNAAEALPFNGHPPVDDETLVARVRSEVLRDQRFKAGEIHLDAYQGTVTLRGQLEHPEDIRKLVRETAHVEGVREVRNFLHLPGTPPPNMAEVYSRYEAGLPSHLAR